MNRKLASFVFIFIATLLFPLAARAQDKPSSSFLGSVDGRLSSLLNEAEQLVHQALGSAAPKPMVADLPKDPAGWPEEYKYLYEERAGIMEHDGGLDKKSAEQKAEEIVRAQWASDNATRGLPADVNTWPEGYRYLYEERAGIMEFDGNMPRAQAEAAAEVIVRDTYLSENTAAPAPVAAPAVSPADITKNLPPRKGPGITGLLDRAREDQKDEADGR